MKKPERPLIRYKFNNECSCDGMLFLAVLGGRATNIHQDNQYTFSFATELSLGPLLSAVAQLPDCHVIEDTLQPEELFNIGENKSSSLIGRLWDQRLKEKTRPSAEQEIRGETLRNIIHEIGIEIDSAWPAETGLLE